jgi:hypothetical protein
VANEKIGALSELSENAPITGALSLASFRGGKISLEDILGTAKIQQSAEKPAIGTLKFLKSAKYIDISGL